MTRFGADALWSCLVMAGLLFPGAQAVSGALEPLPAKENMVIRVEGDPLTVTVVGGENGTVKELVVAEGPDGATRGAPRQATPLPQLAPAPDAPPKAMEPPPLEPVRAVAALMERKAVKTFFAVITRTTDAAARLDAFAEVVASLSAEEVGDVIGMLRDKTVPPSKWEEALAPLADVVSAEERTAMVRALQDRAVRNEVLKSLEQVQLFKRAQAAEARDPQRR